MAKSKTAPAQETVEKAIRQLEKYTARLLQLVKEGAGKDDDAALAAALEVRVMNDEVLRLAEAFQRQARDAEAAWLSGRERPSRALPKLLSRYQEVTRRFHKAADRLRQQAA